MSLNIITDDRRFALTTESKIPPVMQLHECDKMDVMLDVVDTTVKNDEIITTLRGGIAARMIWLFRIYQSRVFFPGDFNCFNAVHVVLGKSREVTWETLMPEQGEKLYVEDALRFMHTPFVFQICGKSPTLDRRWIHEVQHAGLVLGKDCHGEPVVFEKDTHRSLRIIPWNRVWPTYFPSQEAGDYVTCFPIEEITGNTLRS